MATSRIYLKGGPCNGRTVSADRIVVIGAVGYIKCGGGYYADEGAGTRPNGSHIWSYVGTSPLQGPGSGGVNEPHVHSGWRDLRRSVNKTMPHGINRVLALSRQSLRATSHGGKVRK